MAEDITQSIIRSLVYDSGLQLVTVKCKHAPDPLRRLSAVMLRRALWELLDWRVGCTLRVLDVGGVWGLEPLELKWCTSSETMLMS